MIFSTISNSRSHWSPLKLWRQMHLLKPQTLNLFSVLWIVVFCHFPHQAQGGVKISRKIFSKIVSSRIHFLEFLKPLDHSHHFWILLKNSWFLSLLTSFQLLTNPFSSFFLFSGPCALFLTSKGPSAAADASAHACASSGKSENRIYRDLRLIPWEITQNLH